MLLGLSLPAHFFEIIGVAFFCAVRTEMLWLNSASEW